MGNVPRSTVICKCLNLLDFSDDDFPIFNHRRKLTLVKAVKLLIDAVLHQRSDLNDITYSLRASTGLQQAVGLDSISPSQLSRTLGALPVDVMQMLFLQVNRQLKSRMEPKKGIPGIGKLRIMDSTSLTLPEIAGNWAYYSKDDNGVKIHMQLLVEDPGTVYPDKVVCSTRGITDYDVALDLVVDDDAIHVMDRGYIKFSNYKQMSDNRVRFVARIQSRNKTTTICERDVEESAGIQRDADVMVTYKDEDGTIVDTLFRLVEFVDEKKRFYRLLTNVWDMSAEQISEIYRHRWMIELFFKWLKQHLSFVHLYSYRPQAVWNQIYLTLIAYGLTLLVHQESRTKRTVWDMLKLMRKYTDQSWKVFLRELSRAPAKKSFGRRKKPGNPREEPNCATVKWILR